MMGSGDPNFSEEDAKSYALTGRIMLGAIVILFFIVILMVCLHLYVRWFHVQARRRHPLRRRRRSQIVFFVDSAATPVVASSRGLDSSLLTSLPVFIYSSKTHTEQVECPVCLSEFEEGESGRVLPKCNHSFHVDCVDMWFKTHSTCPVCRAAVEPTPTDANGPEVVITVSEQEVSEAGSTSGLCSECQPEGRDEARSGHTVCSSSSWIGLEGKPSSLVGVTLEVPKRSESFGDESAYDSPSSQSSFRSPMSRMRSFKRMLSRDWKASLSPSAGTSTAKGSGFGNEFEKNGGGGREETQ
ncbi:RING-H2 finger protein ATL2-like [Neltuma alba]|uniref:RING-H2 finger protein ATL2-like n=1 Tax=Neltuma alba TaxID=207710 RepID=UPI0010A2BB1D|nr:RING-H2 finger protein ATL2-like [Prosopis alba]